MFLSSPVSAPLGQRSLLFTPTAQQPMKNSHAHENSYTQAYNRAYYAPHSPSPLRTERNANIMSSPSRSNGFKSAGSLLSSSPMRGDSDDTENWVERESNGSYLHGTVQQTPVGKASTATGMGMPGCGFDGEASNLPTPPGSGSYAQQSRVAASVPSPFTFSADPPASTTTRPSQWSLRSRESSPSAQLTTHTARNREERKSKFLDRIRRRRDDERSEVMSDQVLRMDFVKERRGWEEQMARRAVIESLAELEDEEDDIAQEIAEDEEMSPTEEYDDLVREFERVSRGGGGGREEDFPTDDVDDEEYERLFREMEILSQQSQSQSQAPSQSQNQLQAEHNQNRKNEQQEVHQQRTDRGEVDDAMDIS